MKPKAITRDTATAPRSAPAIGTLAGAIAALCVGSAAAQGSGISPPAERPVFTPGVRASALYSDNVALALEGSEERDYIVEVSPYLNAYSSAPRASYAVSYQLRNFWRVREDEANLYRHALDARGSFALVDDRFWLDLSGFMGTITESVGGPVSTDPAATFGDTANVRRFEISPWYRSRLGSAASYELRYALAHAAGDTDFAVADLQHRASASIDGLERGASPWNWRLYGEFERREFEADIRLDRSRTGALLYYRVNPQLRIYGSVEYEQIEEVYNSDGDNSGYGPGAGFEWNPNARTRVAVQASHRYYGTVGSASATYSTARSTMGVRFSRSIDTSAASSLLLFDPVSLTSGTAGINPILADMIARGVVPSAAIALTRGLFTDAALVDRRLTAFWGLRDARNSLTLSAYRSTRESPDELASTTPVTGILGTSDAGGVLVGELRERGAGVVYARQLSPRSSFDVAIDYGENSSDTAGFETRATTLRAGYLTRLTSQTAAFVGARRTRQTASGTGARYDENAVYAGVDVRFR